MGRTKKYSDLTLRKDGIYEKIITVDGIRHAFRSKDPEKVYAKVDAFLNPSHTFASVAEQWREQHYATIGPGTQSGYNPAYKRAVEAVGDMDIDKVEAADINAILLKMKAQGFSARSVQTQKYLFNMIFNFAIMERYTRFNPTTAVKIPAGLPRKTREAPEDDVVEQIKKSINCYWGLFAFFLLHTGCRKGEALAITGADIDRKNKVIHITKAVAYQSGAAYLKAPKSSSGVRDIPLLDALERELPQLKPDQYLFAQENGEPMSSKTYQRHWNHYCKEAGFVVYTPVQKVNKKGRSYIYQKPQITLTAHQLRHGYATILYEAGIDAQTAKVLLGHSDISVTLQIYTHIRNKKKTAATEILNGYFSNSQQNAQLRVVGIEK